MALHDIWRDVGSRIGFHTKETADLIPETAGCYAWFVPLWVYDKDLTQLVSKIDRIMSYDARTGGRTSVTAESNWYATDVELTERPLRTPTQERAAEWARALEDPQQSGAIAQALMEATIFMPPLYVGKADDLRSRYYQHVKGTVRDRNDFHRRFTDFAADNAITLQVSDLLFVCIKADTDLEAVFRNAGLNELLERVIMLLCKPPFSLR